MSKFYLKDLMDLEIAKLEHTKEFLKAQEHKKVEDNNKSLQQQLTDAQARIEELKNSKCLLTKDATTNFTININGMDETESVNAAVNIISSNNSDKPSNTKKLHRLKMELHIDEKSMELGEDGALIISGWCLKEGTWNGVFFPQDEIKKSATGLGKKQFKLNHSRKVEDIAGHVLSSAWDKKRNVMTFIAKVVRQDVIDLILKGLAKAVSVGVRVDEHYDKELGHYYVTDLEFVELSLVDIPAVKGAGIKSKEKA